MLLFEGFDEMVVEGFRVEVVHVYAARDIAQDRFFNAVVFQDVIFDGAAAIDYAFTSGHNGAVVADAVEAVDGGDEGDVKAIVGENGQPGRNTAAGVQDVGFELGECGAELAGADGEGVGIFGAEVDLEVASTVGLDLCGELATVGDDGGGVAAQNELAVEFDHAAFDAALIEFGD